VGRFLSSPWLKQEVPRKDDEMDILYIIGFFALIILIALMCIDAMEKR